MLGHFNLCCSRCGSLHAPLHRNQGRRRIGAFFSFGGRGIEQCRSTPPLSSPPWRGLVALVQVSGHEANIPRKGMELVGGLMNLFRPNTEHGRSPAEQKPRQMGVCLDPCKPVLNKSEPGHQRRQQLCNSNTAQLSTAHQSHTPPGHMLTWNRSQVAVSCLLYLDPRAHATTSTPYMYLPRCLNSGGDAHP